MGSFNCYSRGVTLSASLSYYVSLLRQIFLPSLLDPLTFCLLLPFIALVLVLITTVVLFPFRVSRIFSLTLLVSSHSYLRILATQRLCILFRLSFVQLMWQRLSKNPFINVEVKNLLSYCAFEKLSVVTSVFWRSYIDYSCSMPWISQGFPFSTGSFYCYSYGVTLSASLSYSISLLKQIFLPSLPFESTYLLPSPSSYSFSPYSYHYSCPIPIQSLRNIFPDFIGFLSF